MFDLILSLKPKWCLKILDGVKTVEIRKSFPHVDAENAVLQVYLYCTEPNTTDPQRLLEIHNYENGKIYRANGKVAGVATVTSVEKLERNGKTYSLPKTGECCLTEDQLAEYGNEKDLYGWHISSVQLFEIPKPLSEFGLTRPPQSWCYIKTKNLEE